jgi:hypothetical protein
VADRFLLTMGDPESSPYNCDNAVLSTTTAEIAKAEARRRAAKYNFQADVLALARLESGRSESVDGSC